MFQAEEMRRLKAYFSTRGERFVGFLSAGSTRSVATARSSAIVIGIHCSTARFAWQGMSDVVVGPVLQSSFCKEERPRKYDQAMTKLRDKLRVRTEKMLEPGEQVEQVFLAQSGPDPNLVFLTYLVLFFSKFRVVAVTDRSIVVLSAGLWRQSFPKGVVERLPRSTRLGPPSGALWSRVNLPGTKKTWVHRRFYHDVEAADAALTGETA